MTGAAAGQAGGAQGGGGGAGDAQGADGQPDLAALASQFHGETNGQEELRQQVQQIQELLQAAPWAEGQHAPGEGDDGDDGSDEYGDIDLSFLDSDDLAADPEATAEALADIFDRAVGEQLEPLRAELASQRDELADQRQQHAFELLASELPELQDPEVAREVGVAAQQLAEAMGRPDLAGDAHFWKLTAMAAKAAEYAAEEGAESPTAAHLEGGGGAAPASGQVDPLGPMFDQAGQGGKNALPFR